MKRFACTLSLAVAMLAPMSALAASTPAPVASYQPHVAGSIPLAVSVTTYRDLAYGERASKIVGATVYNADKQAIGKVADLIINPHDSVSIVVVSVGGFLGLGAKNVAISAKNFEFTGNRVVLPQGTKKNLEQLPAFYFAHK